MTDGKHRNKLILYSVTTLLVMCFIFIMSAQDGERSGNFSNSFLGSMLGGYLENLLPRLSGKGSAYDIRKYAHMFEYLCLGISSSLLMFELFLYIRRRALIAPTAAVLFCFLYACSDEWHQTFVPGRAGLFSDVLVDSAGYMIGIITISCVFLLKPLDKQDNKG